MQKPEEIQLTERQEMEAILGRPPGKLVRYGNLIFAVAVGVLLALGWWFPYPDEVAAPARLIASQPPVRVMAPGEGRVLEIQVENGGRVQEGQQLVVMDSPADWQQVVALDDLLQGISWEADWAYLKLDDYTNLGSIQRLFAGFKASLELAQFQQKNDPIVLQVANLKQQISQYEESDNARRKLLAEAQSVVAELQKIQDRIANNVSEGLQSPELLDRATVDVKTKLQEIEQLQQQQYQNRLATTNIQKQLIELQRNSILTQNRDQLKAQEAFAELKGALRVWKEKYLLTAPISGVVGISDQLTNYQYFSAGQSILTIIPEIQSLYAIAIIGQDNIGEIEQNDPVRLHLAGYPYYDYGAIEANIDAIAALPEQGGYEVKLVIATDLIDTTENDLRLKTTYRQYIKVQQEMEGIAYVTTDRNSFLGRLFNKLRARMQR